MSRDFFPDRYYAPRYYPEGHFGDRTTQPPAPADTEPYGYAKLAAYGYGKRKKKIMDELAARKRKAKRPRNVHHDEDDIIAILLALT
jgi:hypothetical protein